MGFAISSVGYIYPNFAFDPCNLMAIAVSIVAASGLGATTFFVDNVGATAIFVIPTILDVTTSFIAATTLGVAIFLLLQLILLAPPFSSPHPLWVQQSFEPVISVGCIVTVTILGVMTLCVLLALFLSLWGPSVFDYVFLFVGCTVAMTLSTINFAMLVSSLLNCTTKFGVLQNSKTYILEPLVAFATIFFPYNMHIPSYN